MFDKPGVLIKSREKLWVFADLVQKLEGGDKNRKKIPSVKIVFLFVSFFPSFLYNLFTRIAQ